MSSSANTLRANSFLNALAGNPTLVELNTHQIRICLLLVISILVTKATLKLLRKAKVVRLVHSIVRLNCFKSCTNPLISHTYMV